MALDSGVGAHNDSAESLGSAAAGGRGAPTDHNRATKKASGRHPICFVCARADSRHSVVVLGMCKVCKCTWAPPLLGGSPFDLSLAEKFDYEKL